MAKAVKRKTKTKNNNLGIIAQELKAISDKQDLQFKVITSELSHIKDDIREIKQTLSSLVRMVAMQESEIEKLKARLSRVEKKVGLNN